MLVLCVQEIIGCKHVVEEERCSQVHMDGTTQWKGVVDRAMVDCVVVWREVIARLLGVEGTLVRGVRWVNTG